MNPEMNNTRTEPRKGANNKEFQNQQFINYNRASSSPKNDEIIIEMTKN